MSVIVACPIAAINDAAEAWGVLCLRYEIKNIEVPESVKHAMQMQVEAERKKRAHILESEGQKTSKINIAEGGNDCNGSFGFFRRFKS